jgi:hypothetical protein
MNMKLIIGIALVIFLVGGTGAFVMMRNRSNTPVAPAADSTTQENQTASPTATATKKSLKDLLTLTGAQKCTFTSTETPEVSDGVVYVSDGKVRGDFTTTVNNVRSQTHVITDQQNVYLWTEGQPTGLKMAINVQSTPGAPGQTIDWNAQADYNCQPAQVDNSLFEIPTTVKFTEFTLPSGSTQCDQCNLLSGELKTKCLETLKCQ